MKYKIIRCFFAVTSAVCILYGSVRSTYHSAIVLAQGTTLVEEQTEEIIVQDSETTSQTDNEALEQNEKVTEKIIEDTNAAELETEYIEEQEQGQDQTLDEYLSLLNCGGCGRNCSLLTPHCHNGSRKASAATEEYYSVYG